MKIVFIVDETDIRTDLDALLRREQTEALLQLLAAQRSQAHIARTAAAKGKPCE